MHYQNCTLLSNCVLHSTPASFPLYCADNIALIVSGMGKCKAAAASAWLAHYTNNYTSNRSHSCWINFGIAGHLNAPLGSVYAVHKVTDYHSSKVWYPPQIRTPVATSNLTTVDQPLEHYFPEQLHDMEASGFIEIARMFTSAELIQCLKVVSDNSESPFSTVNPKNARELISNNLGSIMSVAEHVTELAKSLDTTNVELATEFCEKWRFTVAQTVKLERLLQRYTVLNGTMTEIPDELTEVRLAKAVLMWLETKLNSADYSI